MYNKTTRDISVSVLPVYIEDQSDPKAGRFFWAYRVIIENKSNHVVQLISRYWKITNSHGHVETVEGPGVVGEQPILQPGAQFEYVSGCPLDTSSGMMMGHYVMETSFGETFRVEIPAFSLDKPNEPKTLN